MCNESTYQQHRATCHWWWASPLMSTCAQRVHVFPMYSTSLVRFVHVQAQILTRMDMHRGRR